MSYIEGEGRNQGTLFPVVLDDLVPTWNARRLLYQLASLETGTRGAVYGRRQEA